MDWLIQWLNILLWSGVLFIGIKVITWAYVQISEAWTNRHLLKPDQEGRYPIVTFQTRRGLFIFDPTRNWGMTHIDHDGVVSVKESPAELLESGADVEWARAYSRTILPQTVTQNPSYTYAPSVTRETTAIDNNPETTLAQDVLRENKEEHEEENKGNLPKEVNFFDIIDKRQPGHLILGVDESGQLVQIPLLQAFHQLVVGMSGYGKSIYLRSLVLQILQEQEARNIKLGLADIENNTFPEFRNIQGVEWYAGTYQEIYQLTTQLEKEVDRRKDLYESFDTITPRDIERYNILARKYNKPELPVIVLLMDEFTALMDRVNATQKQIVSNIYQIALRARKYGIYLVLAGHSFKSDVIDTTVTNQFAVSVCFRVRSVHQSVAVLGSPGAERIVQPGEALLKLRDGTFLHIQTPYIDDDDLVEFLETLPHNDHDPVVPDLVRRIIEYTERKLNGRVSFREIDPAFRAEGYSRKDILDALSWMDDQGFTTRDLKNARVLTEKGKKYASSL